MSQLELAGLAVPVRVPFSGHRLDMPVPLEVERLEAEAHRAPAFLAGLVVGCVAAYRLDLPVAVSGVLLRVELVGRRRAAGETVVFGELLEHTRGGTVGAAVHRLDERKQRDALERGAVLAARPDHLDRGERARRGFGSFGLLARNTRLVEHLQHDVDVRLLSAELLHEVLHHDVHERVVPLARDVRDDVAEEDRIRTDTKVVLDLTNDDLVARPTMLDDSLEPGVIRHEKLARGAPELIDKSVVRHSSPTLF